MLEMKIQRARTFSPPGAGSLFDFSSDVSVSGVNDVANPHQNRPQEWILLEFRHELLFLIVGQLVSRNVLCLTVSE